MIDIQTTAQIGRPRDEVFAYLTDMDSLARWQSGVVKATAISEGEPRAGFRFREVLKMGPMKHNAECTITEFTPGERYAFDMKSSGPMDCQARFELQPLA